MFAVGRSSLKNRSGDVIDASTRCEPARVLVRVAVLTEFASQIGELALTRFPFSCTFDSFTLLRLSTLTGVGPPDSRLACCEIPVTDTDCPHNDAQEDR